MYHCSSFGKSLLSSISEYFALYQLWSLFYLSLYGYFLWVIGLLLLLVGQLFLLSILCLFYKSLFHCWFLYLFLYLLDTMISRCISLVGLLCYKLLLRMVPRVLFFLLGLTIVLFYTRFFYLYILYIIQKFVLLFLGICLIKPEQWWQEWSPSNLRITVDNCKRLSINLVSIGYYTSS